MTELVSDKPDSKEALASKNILKLEIINYFVILVVATMTTKLIMYPHSKTNQLYVFFKTFAANTSLTYMRRLLNKDYELQKT